MQITRDAALEERLLNDIKASFDQARTGTHLSDLLNPRQSYWRRVLPLPPTNDDVLYWLTGRGHEDALGRVSGLLIVRDEREKHGIRYRPDLELDGQPTEFKMRRRNAATSGEEAVVCDSYLDQLRGYCAIARVPHAVQCPVAAA